MRAGMAARPRRCGCAAAAVAPETRGKEVGEGEGVAGELTEVRFWAEGGRERELDGDGEARRSGNGGRRSAGVIPAEEWRNRTQRGAVEVEGEVKRLGVRAIEAERRGWSARRPAMALLELGLTRTREEGERDEDEKPPALANG